MTQGVRVKLVIANAIEVAVEINEVMLENARKGTESTITLPGIVRRAFMIVNENGVIPMKSTVTEA